MTQRYSFEFGEWYPDLEDYAHTGLTTARGVYHDIDGYHPIPSESTGTGLPATGVALYSPLAVIDPSDTDYIIALGAALPGGPTSFYRTADYGSGWSATTQITTTALAGASSVAVDAAQLESTIVYCAPGIAEETWISTDNGGTFTTTALGGLTGEVVGAFSQFVLLGATNDTDGEFAVRWSAIGDPSDWPTPNTDDARSKQSGIEYLNPASGKVTGIFGNEFYGLVFQERAITKFNYVGGDVVFAVDTYEERRGTLPGAAVQVEEKVYFCDGYGFYVTDGASVVPIGEGKVDRTYAALTDFNSSGYGTAAHVHSKNLIAWLLDGGGGTTETLFYNYRTGRWSLTDQDLDYIFSPVKEWGSTEYFLGSVTNSGLAGLIGAAEDAVLETAEAPLVPFKRSVVQGIRPFINEATGTSVTIEVGTRTDQSTSVSYTTLGSVNSRTKMHNGRVEGRYHRARFTISGGFDAAVGAAVQHTPQGEM